jgi:uncharacterized enzyme
MVIPEFVSSRSLTLGVELELQLVNPYDYDLSEATADLLRLLRKKNREWDVKPEITHGMFEMATGICENYDDIFSQLDEIRQAALLCADRLDIGICGGGTHPFQHWGERRIYETPRFDQLSALYGYLAKQFTVFGQHVHVGCPQADEALVLMHRLSRYVPHLIALSASSPFVQGSDTGFHSARLNSVFAFPLSGRAPMMRTWTEFSDYFEAMTATGIVKSMKDFYWDIRPKPEYGTVEVRVMDTPLTIAKAGAVAVFIQALARYLMTEAPFEEQERDYLVYSFNRFQACRFGLQGVYVDPSTNEHRQLSEELLETFANIESHAIDLRADAACARLKDEVLKGENDASWLRHQNAHMESLAALVQQQCRLWRD